MNIVHLLHFSVVIKEAFSTVTAAIHLSINGCYRKNPVNALLKILVL